MSFSRAKRFGDIRAAGPGPGRYEVRRLFDEAQPHPKPNLKKAGKLPATHIIGSEKSAFPVLLGQLHHAGPQAVAKMGTNGPVATALPVKPFEAVSNWTKIFQCKGEVGKGACGKVFHGLCNTSGTNWSKCALKRILDYDPRDDARTEAFLKEAKVMRKCQHQYIAEIFFIASGPIPAFGLELLGTSLEESSKKCLIDDEGLKTSFSCITAAVEHLHNLEVAHRDIKPHHMLHLLDSNSWEVKLIDFDACEFLCEPAGHIPATLAYAPMAWKSYSREALDWYALGFSFKEIAEQRGNGLSHVFKQHFLAMVLNLMTPGACKELQAGLWSGGDLVVINFAYIDK